MKRHALRLQLGDYWGTNRPAFPLNLTGGELFKEAEKYGRVDGMSVLRDADGLATSPLALNHVLVFPESDNVVSRWNDASGNGKAHLKEFPFGAADHSRILGHVTTQPAFYMTAPAAAGGLVVPADTGFAIRLLLLEPGVSDHFFTLRWDRYQFVIGDGGAHLMRLSSAWTQGGENAFQSALSANDQNGADTLAALIYEDRAEVEIGGDIYGQWQTLIFQPETAGYVTVGIEGGSATTVPRSGILNARAPGVLWNESPLTIKTNGGIFYWQTGYAQYAPIGEARLRFKTGYFTDVLAGQIEYNGNWIEPTGTNVTLSHAVIDSVWAEIILTLSTINSRVTPIVYSAQAFVDAGPRSGGTGIVLDTNDHVDARGASPVTTIGITQEGGARRVQAELEILDVDGEISAVLDADSGPVQEVGEYRIANVWVNDVCQIREGIVSVAAWNELRQFSESATREEAAGAGALINLTVCDQWAILEEKELRGGELVGDGLNLGGLLARGLRLAGVPDSRIQFANHLFAPDEGAYITPAAPGETWAEVNGETTLADYFRNLLERYGMGAQLWIDGGGYWQFGYRGTTLKTLFGHPVEFSSDLARYDGLTYPGRFAILEPLDSARTAEEFYNAYRAEGAQSGYNGEGEPLCREAFIHESLNRPETGRADKKLLGRRRALRTLRSDSWRTLGELNFGLRSSMKAYGGAPRFPGFITHFHEGLFVGDRVRVDGVLADIRRIESAEAHEDLMTIITQEVEEEGETE